jgi:hypothetical protein
VKKSKHVVLLITGSVLLTACNQQQEQQAGWMENATNSSGTNSTRGRGNVLYHPSPVIYPWYHPGRYFGSDPNRTSVRSGTSSSRSGVSSANRSSSGSSASHSSTSRGGFGSHSSSSS